MGEAKRDKYTRITWFGLVYANIYNRPNGLLPTRKFLATLLRERKRLIELTATPKLVLKPRTHPMGRPIT